MSERGRGMARGQGRGQGRGQDTRRPPQQGPPPQQQSGPSGAWGRRPGPPPSQPGPSAPTPYSRPSQQPQQQSVARGTQRMGPTGDAGPSRERTERDVEGGSRTGGGDAGITGRGAMRGRRPIPQDIHTRPANLHSKKGSTGNTVQMKANYFKLITTTDWCLYQYRVDFAPDEDRTIVRKGLLRLHRQTVGAYVFDGTVLYTSTRLPDNMELWSVRQADEQKMQINIRLVGQLQKGDAHYLQFFNIIMRKCLDLLKLQLVGRNYFDAHSKVEVREYRLELWPGYLTSIRQHESDILMCAEITHKVMRQQTLLDILNDCYQQNPQDYKSLYESQVIGLVVLTGYNNNTYRISDIDYKTNPKSSFQLRGGESITYKDYYFNKYQIRIRNDSQPMLVTQLKPRERRAGQTEFVYLVPELCRATGLTDQMRDNFNLMKALATHTRVAPSARIDKLNAFNRRLRSVPTIVSELKDWNLQLDEHLVTVQARILQPEKLVFANNSTIDAGQYADWSRTLHNKRLFNATRLSNWVMVCTNRARFDAERFVGTLQQAGNGMGFAIEKPRFYDISDDRSNTYSDALERIMSSANPELIFCVVSNNRADRYGAIKKKCTVDRPVPSQVFVQRTFSNKGIMSVATKVAIQLTCKLGGGPWSVELPPVQIMVVGFDVCHDPNNKSRDFGAMVASLDKGMTRYFSAVSSHESGEELSNEFSINMVKAVQNYRQINNQLPTHIIIYRDGVGEGQLPQVYSHEVEQVKNKLVEIYGDPGKVKLAFIVVTKRINTRFFYNGNNPPPGTIVDDIVTNPLKYDFYIISQSVRQGTVSPCAYNVLHDSTGWKPDQMQRLTYKMTHMYYNCFCAVRVPAPCQYAHKLAFLVAQFIRRPPSTKMENLLYFL